jgi:hypothetical protein
VLRITRSLLVSTVFLGLSLLAFSQSNPNAAEKAGILYTEGGVEWPAPVPDGGLLLTVAGPQGRYVRQEFPAGHWARFSLTDDQGQALPDGVYKWELVVQSGWEGAVQSGWFEIREGRPVAEGTGERQPVVIEETAPQNSLYVDSQGRLGIGTSVPQSQLHLKGTAPAFTLEDTATGGHTFALHGLEKGDGSFGLFDQAAGEARWLVDSEGRMGINTTKPTSTFTVDGYIESTKGFLVNGRPVGRFGVIGGSQPLWEGPSNTWYGTNAGNSTMTGLFNSFFGVDSGSTTTSGSGNTFMGWGAGSSNSSGNDSSIFGAGAGRYNTGSNNAFFGQNAGNQNTGSGNNSFFGKSAGEQNGASDNAFFGYGAGKSNSLGNYNSFFGSEAGYNSMNGYHNSFFGYGAGHSNDWGNWNAFFGFRSGYANTSGWNSFFGANTGEDNTTGHGNSFLGYWSGMDNTTGNFNTFVGSDTGHASSVEEGNTLLGAYANFNPGPSPSTSPVTNAAAIGYRAYVAQSNSLVLGSINGVNSATSYVNVGIGTTTPARQLHLAGPNAVFRMDRTMDTAAFLLVRTDPTGATPWKTFVIGTNATGVNQGEFIINDIGTAVGGAGSRRMTITNAGNVEFTGTVYAPSFVPTSSAAFKTNIRTFENALDTVNRLRGVRFDWKDSGTPAVGLIAEEVNQVLPELVAQEGGQARGVNYANLVAVLVEAIKEQQRANEKDRSRIEELQRMMIQQQAEIDSLRSLKAEVEKLEALLRER